MNLTVSRFTLIDMPSRVFGQPVHQLLVVFPLGLLATSFLFDVAWLAHGRETLAVAAGRIMLAGVIGGVVASVVGLRDWVAIPRGSRARSAGALHGGINLVVALLFATSWLLRRDAPGQPDHLEIALSACGVLLTIVTGWLGSEVAERLDEATET